MQLRFGPDDEQAFQAVEQELLSRFERWLKAQGRSVDALADADSMLSFKWGYSDGDLAWWTEGHLDQLLLHHYPRKVVAAPDLIDDTIPAIQAFLDFLDDEGLLSDRSARLEALTEELQRLRAPFRRAMGDQSRWGLGKSLLGAMVDDGVDPTDPNAMDAWVDEFNARTVEERDRVLGPAMVQAAGLIEADQGFRPVVLPPTEELEAAARAAPGLQRIAGLVAYVETERQLTDRGNLKLADARHLVDALGTGDRMDETIGDRTFKTKSSTELETLDYTFRVARQGRFVKVRKGKLSPTQAGRRIDEDPLQSIYQAVFALLEVGVLTHRWTEDRYGFGWYAHEVDAAVLSWLFDWYQLGRQDIDELATETWDHLNDIYDLSDLDPQQVGLQRDLFAKSVRRILRRLEELGVVTLQGVAETPTDYGTTDEHGGTVELTGLGLWLVNRMLGAYAHAPVVGEHADADAATLLERCADLQEDVARAEIDAWVAAREPALAANELAAALRTVGPVALGLGVGGLRRIGRDAAGAVGQLADDPRLAPYVTVWRVDVLDAAADEVVTEDLDEQVGILHAALDLWGPRPLTAWLPLVVGVDGGAPEGQQRIVTVVEELWRPRSDEALEVLDAIANHHEDKRVAKAARKALFKLRSAGLG